MALDTQSIDASESETKKLADSQEEGSNSQNSNENESNSNIQDDEESNILNKSIAEIQSIINNISFFPQTKGECVNNSDITSMSVESSDHKPMKSKQKKNSKVMNQNNINK